MAAAKAIKLKFNKRRLAGFTGNQLKMIAFILMLCDHIGFMLIENGVLYGQNPIYWNQALATPAGQRWYLAARILRFLGRMSYPLFAFLAVEGFSHTRNARKYILRLAFFAAISEVPFDLAIKGVVWFPDYQNTMVTILLGVLSMYFMDKIKKKHVFFQMIIAAVFCGAAYICKCDYGAVGVAMIAVMYIFRYDRNLQMISGAVIAAAESYTYCGVAALSFAFVRFYNGRRGDFPMKYFFYVAYPVHLALFFAMVYFGNR
ncbi:MAG: TraX family protein [Eubacteriales bacterium]|nr:TraX family protein [Eubacteriales bacterium]